MTNPATGNPGSTPQPATGSAESSRWGDDAVRVVTNQANYVRDPAAYQAWRGQVARVLERLT